MINPKLPSQGYRMNLRHNAARVNLSARSRCFLSQQKLAQPLQESTITTTLTAAPKRQRRTASLFIPMSDDAYSSFLDQANQDTGASKVSAKSESKKISTKAVDTGVPKALQDVQAEYTSDSDEPFEPVSVKWSGKSLPDAGMPYFLSHQKLANAISGSFGD